MTDPVRSREIGTVIWLHGLGQSPDTMMAVAQRINPTRLTIRGVFPAAPRRRIGRVTKEPVTAWYDQNVYRYQRMDLVSALATETELRAVLDTELGRAIRGKVVVAGFSQGAALSLMLGLRDPRVAGIMVYAPYLPEELEDLLAATRTLPKDVPIWVGHGAEDLVVPVESGVYVRNRLREWGYPVTWQPYHGGHDAFGGVGVGVLAFLLRTVGMRRMSSEYLKRRRTLS